MRGGARLRTHAASPGGTSGGLGTSFPSPSPPLLAPPPLVVLLLSNYFHSSLHLCPHPLPLVSQLCSAAAVDLLLRVKRGGLSVPPALSERAKTDRMQRRSSRPLWCQTHFGASRQNFQSFLSRPSADRHGQTRQRSPSNRAFEAVRFQPFSPPLLPAIFLLTCTTFPAMWGQLRRV